ncbi:MAG TPA: hypothetical protein VH724_00815 [Candidatus Angelobacter sp.]|nr:hypothetical protein [Candidatus Angelobacter sp.]
MLKTASRLCFWATLVFFLPAASVGQQEGQSIPSAAPDFVQLILSRGGSPSAVSVSFQNLSSLPPETLEPLQNAIFTAFRNANVRLVKAEQAVADVQITFSEDWQGYVWIANIQQGSSSQLVIKKLPRLQRSMAAHAPTITIRKISVWQQDSPILDFYQDNQNLLLLEPGQLSLYASDSGQWRPRQTLGIPHQHPVPRDVRGRLEVHGSEISAFLPGVRCSGKISPPSLDCRASDDPWPIQEGLVAFFSPRRNFFSGLLAGHNAGASVTPFFSGVTWQSGDQRLWLFTGTDGRVRLFQNDLAAPVATFNGWGSTLAAVHSTCGSGWQLLTSAPADSIRPDSIQAVEVTGHEATPVSAPVDLAGAVETLWTAGNYGQVVNGVLHSQQGKYEAFTLSVVCNQ